VCYSVAATARAPGAVHGISAAIDSSVRSIRFMKDLAGLTPKQFRSRHQTQAHRSSIENYFLKKISLFNVALTRSFIPYPLAFTAAQICSISSSSSGPIFRPVK